MDKALEMGRDSATGSFQLFIGVAASTIILAAGTFILLRIMLPEEYGLVSIALIPSNMIILFRDWGVNSAITRHVAYFRSENKHKDIYGIVYAGLIFEITTGIALTIVSLLLANFIATSILLRAEITSLLVIMSITVCSGSILAATQAIFIGFEKMKLYSLLKICQAIIQTAASPLLVFLGFGALGAILGFTLSFLATSIISLAIFYFVIFKNLERPNRKQSSITEILKKMLRYGVPLSISDILSGFMVQFYGFMMAFFCSDAVIGNYQAAAQFASILTFFTIPISTVLFPTFTKLGSQNGNQLLKKIFTSSAKYSALLLAPATMAVMVLSKPMISAFFGEKWINAAFFLSIYVISNLSVVFGKLSVNSLLIALGETKMLMKLYLLTLMFGLPLAFLLIPTLGIVGVILGSFFAGLPSLFWGLHWTWKHYEVKVDLRSSAKILAASTVAMVTTYLLLNFLNMADWIELAIGAVTFLMVYTTVAPLINAITQSDISNLRKMFSGLGIISKLINVILTIAEKAAALKVAQKQMQ
jgi:stage V sporulation protein B